MLNGGGIPNLEVIQTEVNNILDGRAEQIRDFLGKLDTFTRQLNEQRDDMTRAIDSTNRLLAIVAKRNDTLDRVLTEFPPLIKHFADTARPVRRRGDCARPVQQGHRRGADRRRAPNLEHEPAEPAAAAHSSSAGRRRI